MFSRFLVNAGLVILFLMLCVSAGPVHAQAPPADAKPPVASRKGPVTVNDPRASQGYTVIAPLLSRKTTLVDMQGEVVRTWNSEYEVGQAAYLLANGNLLRPAKLKAEEFFFRGAGEGGRIQEFTWEGELVWDYKFHNQTQIQHHDICRLPNGNILMLVWNKKRAAESIAAGRKPITVGGEWLYDSIIEIKPTGKTTAEIVWQWHVWDHLVQDHDKSKANYGDVAAHPELIDINFAQEVAFGGLFGFGNNANKTADKKDDKKKTEPSAEEVARLQSIGYVGTGRPGSATVLTPDWPHLNCVDYNAELDQIMVSSRLVSEFWVIDHSTTTAEAATHAGGKSGKGGDLLYRWGNPRAYRSGTAKDQTLFKQHNAHWIPQGLPGAGNVLVYNNGEARPGGNFSSVDEVVLPVDKDGRYAKEVSKAFEPKNAVWNYTAPKKSDFYSFIISGAHRLPNGNTLICEGMSGRIFEVTADKQLVWQFKTPDISIAKAYTGPSKPGQVMSQGLKEALGLTEPQQEDLAQLQTRVDEQLTKLLDAEQTKQLKTIQEAKTVIGGFPRHGQLLTIFLHTRLKLTPSQKQQVEALQADVNAQLTKTLDQAQRDRLQTAQASAPPPSALTFMMGNMFGTAVFRAYRYPPDYPGFSGRDLKPMNPALTSTAKEVK